MTGEKKSVEGRPKRRVGFATLSPERRREIASRGGHAAHAKGVAHEYTSDEARAAGAKGGYSVSADREHMREIGRRGGRNSHRRGAERKSEEAER